MNGDDDDSPIDPVVSPMDPTENPNATGHLSVAGEVGTGPFPLSGDPVTADTDDTTDDQPSLLDDPKS